MVVIVALATSISTYAIEISKAITKAKLVSFRNKKSLRSTSIHHTGLKKAFHNYKLKKHLSKVDLHHIIDVAKKQNKMRFANTKLLMHTMVEISLTIQNVIQLGASMSQHFQSQTSKDASYAKEFGVAQDGLQKIMESMKDSYDCPNEQATRAVKDDYYNKLTAVMQEAWLAMTNCNRNYGLFAAKLFLVARYKIENCGVLPCQTQTEADYAEATDQLTKKIAKERKEKEEELWNSFLTDSGKWWQTIGTVITQSVENIDTYKKITSGHWKEKWECFANDIQGKCTKLVNVLGAGDQLGEALKEGFKDILNLGTWVTQLLLSDDIFAGKGGSESFKTFGEQFRKGVVSGSEVARSLGSFAAATEEAIKEFGTTAESIYNGATNANQAKELSEKATGVLGQLQGALNLAKGMTNPLSNFLKYLTELFDAANDENKKQAKAKYYETKMCPVWSTWCLQYAKSSGAVLTEGNCPKPPQTSEPSKVETRKPPSPRI